MASQRLDQPTASIAVGGFGGRDGGFGDRVGEESEQDLLQEAAGPRRAQLATPDDSVDDRCWPPDGGETKVRAMGFGE